MSTPDDDEEGGSLPRPPAEDPRDRVAVAILTAQDELNEALEALETLPVAEATHVRLAANSLRNYLTIVTGCIVLLEQALAACPADALPRQASEILAALKGVTARMGAAALALTTGAGDEPSGWTWEAFDLAPGLARMVTYYQHLAAPKDIAVALEDPPAALPRVWADRIAVAAILENLLSNAVKFTAPGGHVAVRLRADADGLIVTVADDGPGLSPRDQARLFRRGVRLTPRPTAGEPSTGYGLAVAKDLAARLGGELWCESVRGRGCAFSLRLPLAGPQGGPPHT
jgi:signal transduction histidine kinase